MSRCIRKVTHVQKSKHLITRIGGSNKFLLKITSPGEKLMHIYIDKNNRYSVGINEMSALPHLFKVVDYLVCTQQLLIQL